MIMEKEKNKGVQSTLLVVVVLFVAIATLLIVSGSNNAAPSTTIYTTIPTTTAQISIRNLSLWSNSPYNPYAYLISGNATLSANGRVATFDFTLKTISLSNSSIVYSMTFVDTGAIYNVTIAPGSKLYFVDTNLADDNQNFDSLPRDDGYAVVNSTGYVTSLIFPLQRA